MPEPRHARVLYHGTSSWENAQRIKRNGFIPSEDGCLGRGVYVAREDKARRFAQNSSRHSGAGSGGLVEVIVTLSNPKYVSSNDTSWQTQGHDACRTNRTDASTNYEWCVRDATQVRVLRVTRVDDIDRPTEPGSLLRFEQLAVGSVDEPSSRSGQRTAGAAPPRTRARSAGCVQSPRFVVRVNKMTDRISCLL